jgi:NAD(P)-dependent dehydrogenase (short-subunit alcohol dehydrogenase family)
MEYAGQTIALSVTDSPLGVALGSAFTAAGAVVIPTEQSGATTPNVLILLTPTFPVQPTLAWDDSDWEAAVQSGLIRSFGLLRAVGAGMVARRRGCILVIGGLCGTTGWPEYVAASAVEGAWIALVRSVACEWARHNVRLVYLAGGPIEDETRPEAQADFTARTPLGQCASPEQIAQVALYLAGERASFLTGSVVRADGGWTAWGLLK